MPDAGGPSSLCIPVQVLLGCISKQAEEVTGSKTVNIIPPSTVFLVLLPVSFLESPPCPHSEKDSNWEMYVCCLVHCSIAVKRHNNQSNSSESWGHAYSFRDLVHNCDGREHGDIQTDTGVVAMS